MSISREWDKTVITREEFVRGLVTVIECADDTLSQKLIDTIKTKFWEIFDTLQSWELENDMELQKLMAQQAVYEIMGDWEITWIEVICRKIFHHYVSLRDSENSWLKSYRGIWLDKTQELLLIDLYQRNINKNDKYSINIYNYTFQCIQDSLDTYIHHISWKRLHPDKPILLSDLIIASQKWIIEALSKFDPHFWTRLLTSAKFHIDEKLFEAMRDSWLVHIPVDLLDSIRQYNILKFEEKNVENNQWMSDKEIAEKLWISLKRLGTVRKWNSVVSIDAPLYEQNERNSNTLWDTLSSEKSYTVERRNVVWIVQEILEKINYENILMLKSLPSFDSVIPQPAIRRRQKDSRSHVKSIIWHYYGLFWFDEMKPTEIAEKITQSGTNMTKTEIFKFINGFIYEFRKQLKDQGLSISDFF